MEKKKWSNPMKELELGQKYYAITTGKSIILGELTAIELQVRQMVWTILYKGSRIRVFERPNTSRNDLIDEAVGKYREILEREATDYD